MRVARRWLIGAVPAAGLAFVVAACWPWPWLTVNHGGDLRYAFVGGENTRFALRWTHSVEREDWIEQYRVHADAIEVVATRFKTFGAGVPAHAGRRTSLEHGWVVMSGVDRVVDPLRVQAASAEHYRMRYAAGPWFALSAPGRAPILHFAAVRAPLYCVAAALWRGWRLRR